MNAWKRITLACFSLLVLGLAPIGAAFAQVKVTAATPSSAVSGTRRLDVVVSGSGFDRLGQGAVLRDGHDQPRRHHRHEGGVSQVDGTRHDDRRRRHGRSRQFRHPGDAEQWPQGQGHDAVLGQGQADRPVASADLSAGATLPSVHQQRRRHACDEPAVHVRWRQRWNGDSTTCGRTANAGSTGATWTFIPGGTQQRPGPRRRLGLVVRREASALLANGTSGTSMLKETWIFNESTQTWSQVTCSRRVLCPSARMGSHAWHTIRPRRARPVRRGGWDRRLLADTFMFNAATKTWTNRTRRVAPRRRREPRRGDLRTRSRRRHVWRLGQSVLRDHAQ